MTLALTLRSITALYRKLEHESYRTLHCRSAVHRADHFLNFCITAHSMQDYFLEHLGKIEKLDKSPFYGRWSKSQVIVAAGEIANSTKHFVLRHPGSRQLKSVATQSVRRKKSIYLEVYQMPDGSFRTQETEVPDFYVRLSDGTSHDLHAFMQSVLIFWKEEMALHGIVVRRQSFASLSGVSIRQNMSVSNEGPKFNHLRSG